MIRFAPQWQTPNSQPLTASPLNEGDVVSIGLQAEDVATISITATGSVSISLPSPASQITSVTVNGQVLDDDRITRTGRTLGLTLDGLTLPRVVGVELRRTSVLSYSLLNGTLPESLVVQSDGEITGVVGALPGDGVIDFPITVRASNGSSVRDRAFLLKATTVADEIAFDTAHLPVQATDDTLNVDYFPLGVLRWLDSILFRFETNRPASVEVRPTGLLGDFHEGMPPGLRLVDNALKGSVAPNTTAGRYLFRLGVSEQTSPTLVCEVVVERGFVTATPETSSIAWVTPQGNLGSMSETYACSFKIEAGSGKPIMYRLADRSRPLPPGLRLNVYTGDIEGHVGHVTETTTYGFTVVAITDGDRAERDFAITVEPRFNSRQILEVALKLRTTDKTGLLARYHELIPSDKLYRVGDVSYGLVRDPYVYLIKGLTGTDLVPALIGDGSQGVFGIDYHGQFDVLLGPHSWAVVRDAAGEIVYEVIYRTIIDPQALAGGFVFGTDVAIEQKVVWAQSRDVQEYVFPRSIRNARLDMTKDLGFATDDPAMLRLTGPTGVEALPRWMQSPQIKDDPSSVLGYVPALLVAHVLPGEADALVRAINADTDLPPNGREVTFDRYFVTDFLVTSGTSFDQHATTYDGATTTFDGFS